MAGPAGRWALLWDSCGGICLAFRRSFAAGGQSTGFAEGFKSISFSRLVSALKALFLDGLLQRRLFVRYRNPLVCPQPHLLVVYGAVQLGSGGSGGSLALPTQELGAGKLSEK